MASFIPIRGTQSEIQEIPISDGQMLMTTDTNRIYIDNGEIRILFQGSVVDSTLSTTSTNPVQNSVITKNTGLCSSLNTDNKQNIVAGVNEVFQRYEEGTWTPVFYSTETGTTSINGSSTKYIKVGNAVYIYGYINLTSIASCHHIDGLPFLGRDGNFTNIGISRSDINESNKCNISSVTAVNKGYSSSVTYKYWIINGWYYTYTS